jgi:hypothetical protein
VVLSGAARRIEIHNVDGEVVTRDPISVTESFSATTETGDVILALPARGPYLVNANTGQERGATVVRVPQTTNREDAAAVVTARSETGDVVIDDLR